MQRKLDKTGGSTEIFWTLYIVYMDTALTLLLVIVYISFSLFIKFTVNKNLRGNENSES